MYISEKIFLIIFAFINNGIIFSQDTKITAELYINPAFTKTWIPDRFNPPFSSSTYALVFGKGHPDIGILGYNYGFALGILIKNKLEFQIGLSKALKGQRNSKEYNEIGKFYDFGMYTERSIELTFGMKFLNRSLLKVKKFNYIIGLILSHYSLITAGYYTYDNPFWDDPRIGSRSEGSDPTNSIFRPGIATEIEYILLNDVHFSFNIGLKVNHYFSSFYTDFNSSHANRPMGYALTIGPSFKLNYHH